MTGSNQGKSERRSSPLPALAVVVLVTLVAFSPVLAAGFIRLDDYTHVLDNPYLRHPTAAGLAAFWSKSYFGLYIPLTYSLWWLCAEVVGAGHHLGASAALLHGLNLALHAINASLVYGVLRTLLRVAPATPISPDEPQARRVALLAALCFALHPAQVESVAWISELKGNLAATCGLLGVWSYYRTSHKLPTAACFLAAMLAKPVAIVFPGILVLVQRILLGKSLKQSLQDPLFYWVPLLPLAVITKQLQPDASLEWVPGISERLLVAADAFAFSVGKLLFPIPLALDYGRSPAFVLHHVPGWQLLLEALVFATGVLVTGYALWRPPRGERSTWRGFVLCGWAIVCLSLSPVLGLVPFELQDMTTVADHYLNLPLLGASLVGAGILLRLRVAAGAQWAATGVLLVLAVLSFAQATRWQSNASLFRHTLRVNPQSYVAHYSMAAELLATGESEEGIAQTRASLAIKPDYLEAQVALGTAWLRQGRFQAVADYYLKVLANAPRSAGKRAPLVSALHNNLGMALARLGRGREAVAHFARAVAIDPQSIDGHFNLGVAASALGKYEVAVTHFQAALALDPGNPEIRQRLALARRRAQPP